MTGRPSSFTQEVADKICERLAAGESLRSITSDPDMPCQTAVYKWLLKIDGFAQQYARARELQADTLADETLDIADDARNDWMTRNVDGKEVRVVDHEHIQRSKLRIEQRKWMAGKLRPKVYGDRVVNEHTGDVTNYVVRVPAKAENVDEWHEKFASPGSRNQAPNRP